MKFAVKQKPRGRLSLLGNVCVWAAAFRPESGNQLKEIIFLYRNPPSVPRLVVDPVPLCLKAVPYRLRLKCDGTSTETRLRLSAKWTSPFKLAWASVQSTAGRRDVRISGSNVGYAMFLGSVKSTGYPLHSPVSPSLPLPCVTLCHHISSGLYVCSGFIAGYIDVYTERIGLWKKGTS